MDEAIREAQRIGAAEADPTHDTHGHDTANKLFIIMKAFTDFNGSIGDIRVEGIQHVQSTQLLEAKSKNRKVKLVATAEKTGSEWKLSVAPVVVDADSFLGTCQGWEMGIEIHTDLYTNNKEELFKRIKSISDNAENIQHQIEYDMIDFCSAKGKDMSKITALLNLQKQGVRVQM